MKKVLIVGSGGREAALFRALSGVCYAHLTNYSASTLNYCYSYGDDDIDGIVSLANIGKFDLVIPGPELPLSLGLGDMLRDVPFCGPTQLAAQLESSKSFTRELCKKVGIPSPKSISFNRNVSVDSLKNIISSEKNIPVFKLSELASGKGVFVPDTEEELYDLIDKFKNGYFTDHHEALLEERLYGTEASLFFACCGGDAIALPTAKDYKRVGDGDTGPNTGGMGAISPHPDIDDEFVEMIRNKIVKPTLNHMLWCAEPFRGFLFVGLMLTDDGPKLIEFNVRLGDPEAQVILPRINPKDLLSLCDDIGNYRSITDKIEVDPRSACCVVMAAPGYPEKPKLGGKFTIDISDNRCNWVNLSAVSLLNGGMEVFGGRSLGVVAMDDTLQGAINNCYNSVSKIHGDFHYRRDIGS